MLKDGGLLLMHDFTLPPNRVLLALWHFYFMTTRNTVARAFPSWIPIYEGLPQLIITTRCVSFSPSDVGSPQSIGFGPSCCIPVKSARESQNVVVNGGYRIAAVQQRNTDNAD